MPIKKRETAKIIGPKSHAMTFRFSKRAADHLACLAEYSGKSKTWVIEELLNDEVMRVAKQDPSFPGKETPLKLTSSKKIR